MQTLIQKTILRKKHIVPQSLSLGKKGNENAEDPNEDSSDSDLESEKSKGKNEVPHPVVEIPEAKVLLVPHVSRKIAMAYNDSKFSLV